MSKKLYVGNLDWGITNQELGQFFASAGEVKKAEVILDRDTGRSRGFGFVEMATKEEARHAIEFLNDNNLNGRPVVVREARPERNAPKPKEILKPGDPGRYAGDSRGKGYGGESDFIKTIKKFVDEAIIEEELSFTSDDKHFTIIRDE